LSYKQLDWQRRRKREGRCVICGKPRNHYTSRCDACAAKARVYMRRHLGCKAKKPSKPGRPTLAERTKWQPPAVPGV